MTDAPLVYHNCFAAGPLVVVLRCMVPDEVERVGDALIEAGTYGLKKRLARLPEGPARRAAEGRSGARSGRGQVLRHARPAGVAAAAFLGTVKAPR
jgi:hypothetical protein